MALAVWPLLSVTVNVTESGCDGPSTALCGPPHTSENERVPVVSVCVIVLIVPYVYCTDQVYDDRLFVPRGNEVDRSSQVVGLLLKRHSVVAPGCDAASMRINEATRF